MDERESAMKGESRGEKIKLVTEEEQSRKIKMRVARSCCCNRVAAALNLQRSRLPRVVAPFHPQIDSLILFWVFILGRAEQHEIKIMEEKMREKYTEGKRKHE